MLKFTFNIQYFTEPIFTLTAGYIGAENWPIYFLATKTPSRTKIKWREHIIYHACV